MNLVVGATGLLGGEICRQLAAKSKSVRALVRSTSDPAKVKALKEYGIELAEGDLKDRLEPGDFSILHKRRFINLRKLYPDIPKPLNDILMHFSTGANVYYEYAEEISDELNRCICSVFP